MSEQPINPQHEGPALDAICWARGTAMCAGCGGLQALHEIYDVLGGQHRVRQCGRLHDAAVGLSVHAVPRLWLYTSMASAPAGAQGVRDALDILLAKGASRAGGGPRRRWC